MKVVSGNRFSTYASLDEIPDYKKTNWAPVVSSVLFSDFQQCLFLSLSVFFH